MRDLREIEVRQDIEPIISALGFHVVEVVVQSRVTCRVTVVIYRAQGISLDDCAHISRTIQPRLELVLNRDDITLEVTSPGIDRVIRSPEEYNIFQRKGVRLLLNSTGTWEGGTIGRYEEGILYLLRNGKCDTIAVSEIRKARLDYTQEVK